MQDPSGELAITGVVSLRRPARPVRVPAPDRRRSARRPGSPARCFAAIHQATLNS